MPRRKYGKLRKPITNAPPHKCRACRQGYACPLHGKLSPKERETIFSKRKGKGGGKKG